MDQVQHGKSVLLLIYTAAVVSLAFTVKTVLWCVRQDEPNSSSRSTDLLVA